MQVSKADIIALDKSQQKEVSKTTNQLKKKIKSGKIVLRENKRQKREKKKQARGLIYLGHLPHGFYEEEIKQFFTQFGRVSNVKVCRSRNTGNSKGYGYVEFLHPEVAKIAAETMNNYLMFKKRITAEFIPPEKRPIMNFHIRQSMPEKYTKQRRRHRNNLCRNKGITMESHLAQSKTRISALQRKLKRINNKLGINYEIEPVEIPQQLNE